MENKDRFDAFMRLAEFQQVGFERRINIEWKMTTVLWSAIVLGTWYLKTNQISLPCVSLIFYSCFFVLYLFWLGLLGRANYIDKSFKEYYRNEAEQVLEINIEKQEHPEVRKSLYWGAWLWFEFLLTGGLLIASYCILRS